MKQGVVHNVSDDRVLVLEPIDDKSPLSSKGMVDKRLFTGENKLHAIKDQHSSLWSLQYESGVMPPELKQRFTGFSALIKTVEDYFKKRNIKIAKVIA